MDETKDLLYINIWSDYDTVISFYILSKLNDNMNSIVSFCDSTEKYYLANYKENTTFLVTSSENFDIVSHKGNNNGLIIEYLKNDNFKQLNKKNKTDIHLVRLKYVDLIDGHVEFHVNVNYTSNSMNIQYNISKYKNEMFCVFKFKGDWETMKISDIGAEDTTLIDYIPPKDKYRNHYFRAISPIPKAKFHYTSGGINHFTEFRNNEIIYFYSPQRIQLYISAEQTLCNYTYVGEFFTNQTNFTSFVNHKCDVGYSFRIACTKTQFNFFIFNISKFPPYSFIFCDRIYTYPTKQKIEVIAKRKRTQRFLYFKVKDIKPSKKIETYIPRESILYFKEKRHFRNIHIELNNVIALILIISLVLMFVLRVYILKEVKSEESTPI